MQDNVLEKSILNVVRVSWILTNGPYGHSAGAIASYIIDVEVSSITFDRDAIVTLAHVS